MQDFHQVFRYDLLRHVKKQGQDYGHQHHTHGRKLNVACAIHY